MNPTTHPTSGDPDIARRESQARAQHAAGDHLAAADTELKLGSHYLQQARFLDAERAYTTARQTYTSLGLRHKAADCDHNLGAVYHDMDRYEQAEQAYACARQTYTDLGTLQGVADCDHGLGNVYTSTGRYEQAEQAYKTARLVYINLGLPHEVPDCDHNLGNVYEATGRYEEAEQAYRTARHAFADLGQPLDAADCDHGLGNMYEATGRYEEAEQAFTAARQTYTHLGLRHGAADCDQNLGNIYYHTGRYEQAEQAFTTARQTYIDLGLWVATARCDVNRAMTRWAKAQSMGTPAPQLFGEVLDLLITAALVLTAVRFQFPTAQARAAWMAAHSTSLRSAFAITAELGDARLIAELVEISLNVGIHTADQSDPPTPDAPPAAAVPPQDLAKTTLSTRPEPWNTPLQADPAGPELRLAAGMARLMPGAMLPLAPPPRLQMPDGRIALDHYRQLAETRYGITAHTNQIIPTW